MLLKKDFVAYFTFLSLGVSGNPGYMEAAISWVSPRLSKHIFEKYWIGSRFQEIRAFAEWGKYVRFIST